MKDVKCEYDYVGTANLSVEVSDMAHKYPIGTETKNLKLPFYIASGNTLEEDLLCGASTTDDDPNTEEVEFPQWQDCKEPYKHEITVSVSSGFGTVDIYRNDEFIGKATEVISFIVQFSSEDIAKFVATPSTGYSFESWCGDDDCCSPPDPECGPTISRTINADGNLYANFESV